MTEQDNPNVDAAENGEAPGGVDTASFMRAVFGVDEATLAALEEECEAIASNWEAIEVTDELREDATGGMIDGIDKMFGDDALKRLEETMVASGLTSQGLAKIRDGVILLKRSLEQHGPNVEWMKRTAADYDANDHFNARMAAAREQVDSAADAPEEAV